jgi:hypothetical protein
MRFNDYEYIGKVPEYNCVYLYVHKGNKKEVFKGSVFGVTKFFEDVREAAKWVDIKRIRAGKQPCNILKRVV